MRFLKKFKIKPSERGISGQSDMDKDWLIKEIMEMEWEQFTHVKNIGKRAYCQDRKKTFLFSRRAYFWGYSEQILLSYRDDLIRAKTRGISLVANKYESKMKKTNPSYFKNIQHQLIECTQEKENLVDCLMFIIKNWLRDIQDMEGQSRRKFYSKEDNQDQTSVETYFFGEYCSYSEKTLKKILIADLENYLCGKNRLKENLIALG